jgi:uncharacterized protein YegL
MAVEIVCVLDRSGSMDSIIDDSIGGFNVFLSEQQALPGDAKLTLILFDDQYEVVYDRINLQDVSKITSETYTPRGTTALHDALGKSINSLGESLSNQNKSPEKVIFVILTDGGENASKEFTKEQINKMIKHQQEKYSWEFIFLAANQDAFSVGDGLGISAQNIANFSASSLGTQAAYSGMSTRTSAYRGQ